MPIKEKELLFTYCIGEILKALKEFRMSSDIDSSFPPVYLDYIAQCMRYIYSTYLHPNTATPSHTYETAIGIFTQTQLHSSKNTEECSVCEQLLEFSVRGMASGSLAWHAQVLCYLLVFGSRVEVGREEKVVLCVERAFVAGFLNVLNAVVAGVKK